MALLCAAPPSKLCRRSRARVKPCNKSAYLGAQYQLLRYSASSVAKVDIA